MPTYAELAPTISGAGVTKAQARNYFASIPEKPAAQPEPSVTKSKVVAIANALFSASGLKGAGGIKQIASDNDLTTGQVKTILKEIDVLHADYLAKQSQK